MLMVVVAALLVFLNFLYCSFGVMHVLEPSLEVEGLFLCKGADPEFLFSANEDT